MSDLLDSGDSGERPTTWGKIRWLTLNQDHNLG